MAEVSADDVRLDYDSDEPALQPIATAFDDNLGNGDGRWDAGETAGVLLTLKNFGSDASGVEATLACSDPLVTILDGAASFGDIPRGGTAGGTAPSFTVRASPHAPAGHVASCTLRIVHDSGESVSALGLTIGRHAVFVWDPTFLQSTGRALREILPSLGTPFTFSDLLPPNLEDHTLLFALLGVYPDNFVVRQVSSEATAIEPFFGDGHGVYLEGGDVWYFDPISMSGYPFAARFGLQAVEDGMADAGMVIGETLSLI
ncbi:MAG: hypothetical protein QUU85_15165, partial [Candidatus Eisenbacteria bacterium]|nr:hypothetical protein [Candidatus Eisenbacteria bacterium]